LLVEEVGLYIIEKSHLKEDATLKGYLENYFNWQLALEILEKWLIKCKSRQ